MSRIRLELSLACLLAVTFYAACQTREREAAARLMQADTLLRNGNWLGLKEHLHEVISEYPDTEAAETAAQMLEELTARTNGIAEKILMSALTASMAYAVSYPDDTLDIQKIQQYGFLGLEGVEVTFVRNEASDFLITSQHVAGDKVFTVGRDGVISTNPK